MGWIIVLLFLAAGGVYAYRILTQMEREIRAEIDEVSSDIDDLKEKQPEHKDTEDSIETTDPGERILFVIRTHPGIYQKDIYPLLEGIDKKMIQKLLLNYDRSGKVLRKSVGNTYTLTLIE